MLSCAKKRYLLAIYELSETGEEVCSKDIARALHVKRPSVAKMLKTMEEEGLFCKEYYGRITLSKEGARVANGLFTKYLILYEFFLNHLLVSKANARRDAITCLCDLSADSVEKVAKMVLGKNADGR